MIPYLVFLRSIVAVLVLFPVWTAILSLLTITQNILWGNRRFNDIVIGHWARFTCRIFGVQIEAQGLENIPSGGCLFLFNHRSFFDIFAIQALVPTLRFGGKIELFRIPVFGLAMRRAGALPIARGNIKEVIQVYQQAEGRLRAGERFALSPEGGRNTTSQELLPFKAGPFLFALGARAPIVPCLVFGADQVWPKGALVPQTKSWSSVVVVRFLPPIPVPEAVAKSDSMEFRLEAKASLQSQVYEVMKRELARGPARHSVRDNHR